MPPHALPCEGPHSSHTPGGRTHDSLIQIPFGPSKLCLKGVQFRPALLQGRERASELRRATTSSPLTALPSFNSRRSGYGCALMSPHPSLLSVVALKCRAHFIAEHICASQQNSLDPDCWDLCNLVGFGPRAAVPSQRAECACTALIRLAQWFAHLQHQIWVFSNQ